MIIGSVAALHWFPDWREPVDIDVLSPDVCPTEDRQWHRLAELLVGLSTNKQYADPWILHTLKVSHAYWDIHWNKTMYDIDQFQQRGVRFDQGLHDQLVPLWTEIHGAKKVRLMQSTNTFWDDAVVRRYDHEWLHRQAAFYVQPLHERVRPDLKSTWVSKRMFDDLSSSIQLDLVLEEILTTAIERADLGVKSIKSERLSAFSRAHFLLCTSMAKGWFSQFCVQNARYLKVNLRDKWYHHLDQVLINLSEGVTK